MSLRFPSLRYSVTPPDMPKAIPEPDIRTVLCPLSADVPGSGRERLHHLKSRSKPSTTLLRKGDAVHGGVPVTITDFLAPLVSPVDATIVALRPLLTPFGEVVMAVDLKSGVAEDAEPKEGTEVPPAAGFRPHRILVNGLGEDLESLVPAHVLSRMRKDLESGLKRLAADHPAADLYLFVPEELAGKCRTLPAHLIPLPPFHPAGHRVMLHKTIRPEDHPTGRSLEALGSWHLSVLEVCRMGEQDRTGTTILTVIHEDGTPELVSAFPGTPVSHILDRLGILLNEGDLLRLGGPMAGVAAENAEYPVTGEFDTVRVIPKKNLPEFPDADCDHCGECVRACPAMMPVHLLVRVLMTGDFDRAADEFELDACIHCGLCSAVCPSRIPVLQHIRLAQSERGLRSKGAAHV